MARKKISDLTKEKQEEVAIIRKDVENYAAIEGVANSEGGQIIAAALRKDASGALSNLLAKYKTASDTELRAWCAVLGERLALLKSFVNAPKNRQGAIDRLDEILNS